MNVVAPGTPIAPLPAGRSLRAKAFIATLMLVFYVLGSVVHVSMERAKILESIQTLQQISRHDKALALAEAAVNGAVVDVSEASNAELATPLLPSEITLYMESCAKLFAALDEFDPYYASLQRAIANSYDNLKAAPVRANWIDLREQLGRASQDLEIRHRNLSERRDALTQGYQRQYDAVTIESLLLSLLGIALFGALAAWFFTRLTGDIRRLEAHARQIVHGSRGVALPVTREDELGRLMHAVNRMSADLDEREKRIELDGQRRSHQDKMTTVGALAAGVAHEVNNPLAVISGVAQELIAMEAGAPAGPRVAEAGQLILAQAQRASQATRNLADVAAPQPTEFDWVDANAMVRRVLQLMGYDKRYRHIAFETELATDVPAVQAPGDLLQQVLMQIMSLGCDAMAALPRGTAPVRTGTSFGDGFIHVAIDFPAHLDFTRAEVQRVLLLCRAMVEPLGARLALDQARPAQLHIKLCWPVDPGS